VARKFPQKTTRPCRHFGFPGYERAAGFQWSSGTSRGGKTFWKKTRRDALIKRRERDREHPTRARLPKADRPTNQVCHSKRRPPLDRTQTKDKTRTKTRAPRSPGTGEESSAWTSSNRQLWGTMPRFG